MAYEYFTAAPDILHTGISPAAQQIINGFISKLGLSEYFGERISFEMYAVTNSVASDEHIAPTFTENSVDVDVNYSFQTSSLKWPTSGSALDYQQLTHTPSMKHWMKELFKCKEHKLELHAYDYPVALNMEAKFNFEDVVSATQCMQFVQSYASTGIMEFEVDYDFFIPDEIYAIIFLLYKMNGEVPEDFLAYLDDKSNQQLGRSVNRHDQSDNAITARRTKIKINTAIEMSQDAPEPIGDNKSPNGFRVNISIHTQMNMPNLLGLKYPIIAGNQLVPGELIPVAQPIINEYEDAEYPFLAIECFRQLLYGAKTDPGPLRLPWYDNWEPNLPKGYYPSVIGAFLLDDVANENGVTILDLTNDYDMIDPRVWDLYKLCGQSALGYGNLLNISVFRDDVLISPSALTLDENLLLTIEDRSITPIYRVVFTYNPTYRANNQQLRILNAEIIPKRM